MLFLKAAGALAAAALIGSAACVESPEALDLSSPESEEFYAEAAASRGAAAAPAPTLKERLQALQEELRAWQEAQQTKMKASHDELVALWRAAAAAAQERIRLSQEMQALKKEAVKDLLEAFFEWLRKLVAPTPSNPFPPIRPHPAGAAGDAAEAVEGAEARKEADRGLRQEAEALLQAIQEILQRGCGKDDEDDDKQQQQQQQGQQQQGQQQGGSDAAGPAPSQPQAPEQQQQPRPEQQQEQQQQQEQEQETVVRDSKQPKKGKRFFPVDPEMSYSGGAQTPEKPLSGNGEQQQPQQPEQQPQQPQQPDIEQVDPEIPGHQPGNDEQPIDPEFSYPAFEGVDPELLPPSTGAARQMLLINMNAALLTAAVSESVYKADATVKRLSAAASAAAAGGTVIAAGPFRGSGSEGDSTRAQGAQQILQELQEIKSGLDDMNRAAAAEFAACDDQEEHQRLRVLKNWLVGINVFQLKLLQLSAKAQQLGIQTDSVPFPPIAQGYPLPRPEEAKPREYEYAFYPAY